MAQRGPQPDDQAAGLSPGQIVLAWLTQFLVGTDLFVVAPLLPDIARSYDVHPSSTGLLVTSFSIAYVVAAPFAGRLADQVDRRWVLVWALVLFSMANVATALAPNFSVLLLMRVLAGIAGAATGPTVYALVSTRARPKVRAQVLAIVGSGLLTALWVGAPAGAILSRHAGWEATFLLLAAGTLVLAAPNALAWRGPGAAIPAGAAASEEGGAKWAVVAAVTVTTLWAFSVYCLYTFLGVALDTRGNGSSVPLLLVVYGVGAVIGGQVGGRLADRAGAIRVGRTALVLAAVLEIAVAVAFPTPWALACALAPFAVAAYAFFPAQQRRLVDLFPGRATGVLSWNNSALFVGLSLAGAVGGPVLHAWSYEALLFGSAMIALLAVLATGVRHRARLPVGQGVQR